MVRVKVRVRVRVRAHHAATDEQLVAGDAGGAHLVSVRPRVRVRARVSSSRAMPEARTPRAKPFWFCASAEAKKLR